MVYLYTLIIKLSNVLTSQCYIVITMSIRRLFISTIKGNFRLPYTQNILHTGSLKFSTRVSTEGNEEEGDEETRKAPVLRGVIIIDKKYVDKGPCTLTTFSLLLTLSSCQEVYIQSSTS